MFKGQRSREGGEVNAFESPRDDGVADRKMHHFGYCRGMKMREWGAVTMSNTYQLISIILSIRHRQPWMKNPWKEYEKAYGTSLVRIPGNSHC